MSNVVRITAEYTGDPGVPADEDSKIVLHAVLNGTVLQRQLWFGCFMRKQAGSVERWPFVLRPLTPDGANWLFDYGAGAAEHPDGAPEPTNLMDREIRVDSYFTVGEGKEEATYRITEVISL